MKIANKIMIIGIVSIIFFAILGVSMVFLTTSELDYDFTVTLFVLTLGSYSGVCLIGVIFSILLVFGVTKNKPGFVRAYLMYGFVYTIISVILVLITCLKPKKMFHIAPASVVLVKYMFCLNYVNRVYDSMKAKPAEVTDEQNLIINEM